MCRVNSFLGCIRLETFAVFIGWLDMVLSIIVAFISILAIVASIIEQNGIAIAISLLVLIICFLMACVCRELVEGVETRESAKVQKFRILCCVFVIFGIVQVLRAVARIGKKSYEDEVIAKAKVSIYTDIILSLMLLGALVYVFVCIDSLYKMFERERFPTAVMQQSPYIVNYQPPMAPSHNLHSQHVPVPVYYSSMVQKY